MFDTAAPMDKQQAIYALRDLAAAKACFLAIRHKVSPDTIQQALQLLRERRRQAIAVLRS